MTIPNSTYTASGPSPASLPSGRALFGKRVAVVTFSHYPSDPRPRRAAEALAQKGALVEVICLKQSPDDQRRDICSGVSILRLPVKNWRGGKILYFLQYAIFLLLSFLILGFRSLTRRYSLVHAHNMPDVLVFAALVPKLLGARIILDLHDPMPELMMTIYGLKQNDRPVRLLRFLEKLSIGMADAVLTPNAAFERLFVSRSARREKLHVVMNSPDEGIFRYREVGAPSLQPRNPAEPYVVMYHGALVERHGLDIAVHAIKLARESIPGLELHIHGRSTPFLERVMCQVKELGLSNAVRYFGPKTLEQIAAAIDDCDLGIVPNPRSVFTEINLPTRIFEYLARGKAVIAPHSEGIRDYFASDELLFLERVDAEGIASIIQHAFSHPAAVEQIIKRGQAVYRAHRWSEEKSRLIALASELVDEGENRTQARHEVSHVSVESES